MEWRERGSDVHRKKVGLNRVEERKSGKKEAVLVIKQDRRGQ